MTEATMEAVQYGQDDSIRNVLGARFQTNPDFELVPFERLPREQQQQWKELARDPSFYGLLLPKEGTPWRAKSACRETVLLFFTLQSAGFLPAFAIGADREAANRAIAQLVLDGILTMEANGGFLTGPSAAAAILRSHSQSQEACPLAALSAEAVAYGASLLSLDAGRLSARMYFYNRLPLTPAWQQRFRDIDAVRQELGPMPGWTELPVDESNNGWVSWQRTTARAQAAGGRTYKLYFSPRPEHLREAFPEFAAAITRSGCLNCKAGRNAAGLLRPDKAVAYFHSQEQVMEAAQSIDASLAGCPAQGVPFTAPAGNSLLVSWGVDPPTEEWEQRESWRLWVTNRLAVHLKAAHAVQDPHPQRFAVDRMRLESVDTSTWTPANTIWTA